MSTVQAPPKIEAVHMRLVYFKPQDDPPAPAPITPADLTHVFQQLELLIDYAWLTTQAPTEPPRAGHSRASHSYQTKALALWMAYSRLGAEPEDPETPEPREEQWHDPATPETAPPTELARIVSEELGVRLEDIELRESQLRGPPSGQDLIRKAQALSRSHELRLDDRAALSVVALRMGSPLEILVEIPPATWPLLGLGLLALAERIATMPVRIARKRREELLKSAMLDRQTSLVSNGRADVLAELLLRDGHGPSKAPDEIAFLDPGDPDDELEAVSPAPAHM